MRIFFFLMNFKQLTHLYLFLFLFIYLFIYLKSFNKKKDIRI